MVTMSVGPGGWDPANPVRRLLHPSVQRGPALSEAPAQCRHHQRPGHFVTEESSVPAPWWGFFKPTTRARPRPIPGPGERSPCPGKRELHTALRPEAALLLLRVSEVPFGKLAPGLGRGASVLSPREVYIHTSITQTPASTQRCAPAPPNHGRSDSWAGSDSAPCAGSRCCLWRSRPFTLPCGRAGALKALRGQPPAGGSLPSPRGSAAQRKAPSPEI